MTFKLKQQNQNPYFYIPPTAANAFGAVVYDDTDKKDDQPEIQTLGGDFVPDEEANRKFAERYGNPNEPSQAQNQIPAPVQPTNTNSNEADINRLENLIYNPKERNNPENKPNRWLSGGVLALQKASEILMNGGNLYQALGAGIGGFGGGAAVPKAFADLKHGNQLAFLYKKRDEDRREQDRQMANAVRREQILNMRRDDQRNVEQFNTREQNRFLLEQRRFENRMQQIDKQAQIEGNKWKKDIDEQGRVWKLYNNGTREPMPDPDDPSKQDIDPNFKTYQVYSPMSGTLVSVKGSQLYSDESKVAASQVAAVNKDADNEYEDGVRAAELKGKIANADSRISSLNGQLAGLQSPQTQEDFAKKTQLEKELREAKSDRAEAETQLKSMPKRKAVQPVNSSKVVPPSKDPMGLYQ